MTDLAGKTIWITGASSGIGEAMAVLASRQGVKLVLSARRVDELERVRAACADPAKVAVLPLDLTQFDAEAARAAAEACFGPIDVLVNNAGISQRSLMLDTSMDVYRRIMELDFFATVALTKAVVPGMRARGGGHVVVISSVVGKMGTPLRTGYAAAKHALHGFFESARAELWRDQVRFTLVCPGFIRTEVSRNAITGDGGRHDRMDDAQAKGMDAQTCAARIWAGVARNAEELYVGREQAAIYLKRWAPALVSALVKRAKVT
ncbi:SDR family oxidoreductase [Solimonas flava]|uniref:SDR family oxidoreductase n=1 Tax=Solimonas flava TaxID=415849 RepID=UPI0004283303|nr:SDR family oxidoreductase [Solimonas flava]